MPSEYVPSLKQIQEAARQIRAEWSENERIHRRVSSLAHFTDQEDGYSQPPLHPNSRESSDDELN